MTSTVELKVNFLRPARLGSTLITEAKVQSAGRSLVVVSGYAMDAETGKKVGLGLGTFNVYEVDRLAPPAHGTGDGTGDEPPPSP